MADLPVEAGTISYPDSLGSLASGWSSGETPDTRLSRVKCNPPKGLRCFYKLTLDLWLNFDSSICIITPGPPICGIGWRSSAPHATSRHFLANLTRTFLDAVPSIAITFKESFCAHFQRKCNCLPKEFYFQRNMSLLSLTRHVDNGNISCWVVQNGHFRQRTYKMATGSKLLGVDATSR